MKVIPRESYIQPQLGSPGDFQINRAAPRLSVRAPDARRRADAMGRCRCFQMRELWPTKSPVIKVR